MRPTPSSVKSRRPLFNAFGLVATTLIAGAMIHPAMAAEQATPKTALARPANSVTTYHTMKVDGLNIFYREAGPKNAPTLLLLHGFPTSSHMFRDLIPQLSDRYHVIAPDYPGFGQSDAPPVDKFSYTFDHLAEVMDKFTVQAGLSHYALYVQDYGAPIGFRLATAHPERISAIVVQNGNAYEEGFAGFWEPIKAYWADRSEANGNKLRPALEADVTKWQYTEGARDASRLSPDAWTLDQAYMDRPGNKEIQLALFYSYGSNPPHYPEWQAYFRKYQPPMLIAWGKNDKTFAVEGATAYHRDLPKVETHLLNTGHFALEEDNVEIARLMRAFFASTLKSKN